MRVPSSCASWLPPTPGGADPAFRWGYLLMLHCHIAQISRVIIQLNVDVDLDLLRRAGLPEIDTPIVIVLLLNISEPAPHKIPCKLLTR